MPRKTDSRNPTDWLTIAASEFEMVRLAAQNEVSFCGARSKLAEIVEKVLKAELIRLGWALERTHDLNRLLDALVERNSDLLPMAEPLCDHLAQVYFTDRRTPPRARSRRARRRWIKPMRVSRRCTERFHRDGLQRRVHALASVASR